MYKVFNTIEEKVIFSGNLVELIQFMKKIAIENEGENVPLLGISDIENYMKYCDNLKINLCTNH